MLRNQGFGISRDDYYPVDMMEHLLRRRGDVDQLPPNVKLFTLLGGYVDEIAGHTYYGKASTGCGRCGPPTTRRCRTSTSPDADDAAEGAAAARPRRRRGRVVPPGDGDVRQHVSVRRSHHPALSLPCGMSDGLPVGLMLVGRHYDEATLYRVAQAYEQA